MGKYDKEREALGLKPLTSSTSPSSDSNKFGKYAKEREALINPSAALPPSKSGYSMADRSAEKPYVPAINKTEKASETYEEKKRKSREIPVVGPILRTLDAVAENPVVETIGEIGRSLYTPGAGLANVAGFTGAVGTGLSRVAPKLGNSTTIGGRVAQEAIKEGVTGVPIGAGQALATGQTDVEDVAKNAALGLGFGALGGASAPVVGAGLKKFAGTETGKALANLFNRRQAVNPEIEAATVKAFESIKPASNPLNIQGTLKPASQESYINRIMTNIHDEVNTRMTPPLENPNELAKWLRPHLGDASLNEVRKFSYDDMVELAEDVRRSLNMYDIAVDVAKSKGYKFDEILSGKLPSVTQRVQADASKRAYGIYDAPQIPLSRPMKELAEPVTAEAMRGNWFTNLFGDFGVGFSALGKSSKGSNKPLTTAGQIVNNPLKKDIQGVKANAQATARATYQNFVDQFSPLKKFGQSASKTGTNLTTSKNPYNSALSAARANNIANVIVDDKLVTPEGVVVGEGLANIFKKVARGQDKKFLDYLVLRHAETRMGRGEKVYDDSLGMTAEKVQQRINDLETRNKGFKDIAAEYDRFTDNLLRTYGLDEGLISPELYKALRDKNPNYVPMRRQFSLSEKFLNNKPFGTKSSFSGQRVPFKEVSPTGSTRRIVDPRRTLIEYTGGWVNAAMRNRVMQNIVDVVKKDPEAWKGFVEIVQKPKGQRNISEILMNEGADGLIETLDDDFGKLFRRTNLDQDNIVRAMVKGEPVYLQIKDPEIVKALVGMGPEATNFVMDTFNALSKATKYGATGALAPFFSIKNLTADALQSLIQSEKGAHQLWNMGHAILSQLADYLPKGTPGFNRMRELAEEYRRAGGVYSAALRGDRELKKGIGRMRRDPILSASSIGRGLGQTVAAPFKVMNAIADVTENAPRMAAFKTTMNSLGGQKTRENVTQAMRQAQEITTNYSRRGNQSRNIEKVVPYSNAAMQGLYRFVRQWRTHPFKTAAIVGGAVMVPKAYEYLQFGDDPDYQRLPAREKYRNLILSKNEDGTFVKVPMPQEYAALGAFMVDSLEWLKTDDWASFKGSADAVTNAYTPPMVSGLAQPLTQGGGAEAAITGALGATVLSPLVSMVANKDFAGRPIESMALQDRSPQYRFDERTSEPAKIIGDKLNLSPQKVDYLIRAYGGDPARLLLPLTSTAGSGATRNVLLKNFIVDPVFTNTLTNDFYTAKNMLSQAYRDNKEADIPLPSWYDDNLRKEITSTAEEKPSKKLSKLTDQKKAITMDKSLTNARRTEKLRDIQRQMNEIYLEMNAKVMEKKIPIPKR
jgi:hypothetical protein